MLAIDYSKLQSILVDLEKKTNLQVKLCISKRFFEIDSLKTATRIFQRSPSDSLLIYLNLRRKTLAFVASETVVNQIGFGYIEELTQSLKQDIHRTCLERAILLTLQTLTITLSEKFSKSDPH